MKIKILTLIFMCSFLLLGCANKYKLEKSTAMNFTEASYKKHFPGIKGGIGGVHVKLIFKEDQSTNTIKNEVIGIYFKNAYTPLVFQGNNTFQAFVKSTKQKKNSFLGEKDLEDTKKVIDTKVDNKKVKDDFPFQLKDNEAILLYKQNNKEKYVKITLIEEVVKSFPM